MYTHISNQANSLIWVDAYLLMQYRQYDEGRCIMHITNHLTTTQWRRYTSLYQTKRHRLRYEPPTAYLEFNVRERLSVAVNWIDNLAFISIERMHEWHICITTTNDFNENRFKQYIIAWFGGSAGADVHISPLYSDRHACLEHA